jgi:heterodisulfide reductase subunit B
MKYAYYPGCSSENLTSAYEVSLQMVAAVLGMDIETIPDWNCCGATEYMAVNRLASYAVAARNLALVPSDRHNLVTSCSACFLNLKRAQTVMLEHDEMNRKVNEALAAGSLSYSPSSVNIRHILGVLVNDIGLDHIREQVKSPLSQLRAAPYYGCMLVRPVSCFDEPEYPITMDVLLQALGAEVADFSLRGYCCGGHMPQIKADTGYEIIWRILKNAQDSGANIIAVTCPVCQMNLDLYQEDVNKQFGTQFDFPILFFTQLMGLAFGLEPFRLGIDKEAVSEGSILQSGIGRGKRGDGKSESTLPSPEISSQGQ